jgi:hypothetical protein
MQVFPSPLFRISAATLAIAGILSTASHAATFTWDGEANDGLFNTAANWVGDSVPPSSDFSTDLLFSDAVATPETVTKSGSQKVNNIAFVGGGWTLAGGTFDDSDDLTSTGTGVNTITTNLNQKNSHTWVIENTVIIEDYYQRSKNMRLDGGGLLRFTSQIDGFGGTGSTYLFRIDEGTLQVDASSSHVQDRGAVAISGENSVLRLKTSVANAQSQIGDEIINETIYDLFVNDVGGGYVEVFANVPEPGSLALVALGSLLVMGRRRDGKA